MDTILRIAEESLLPAQGCIWNEGEVPLAKRGVAFGWLYDFAAKIDKATGEMWQRFYDQQRSSIHFDHVPWPERPEYPEANFKTRAFVEKIVIPLTDKIQSPLYARVPQEHRGSPSIFISHTWDSFIVRGAHGTLDMVLDRNRDSFVWIDFTCYNQHLVKNESIAKDMNSIISEIGDIALVLTTEPFFTRSWCLWELVCAHRSNVPINVYDQIDRIKYKYWSSEVSELPPDFNSITALTATKRADKEQIFDLLISTFGTVDSANSYIQNILSKHRKNR